MKLDINVPQFVFARDYHEFSEWDHLLERLNSELTVSEIACEGGTYIGIIYWRVVPTREEILKLADEQDVYLGEDFYDAEENT